MITTYLAELSPRARGTLFCVLSGTLFGVMGIFATGLYSQAFSIPCVLFWRFFMATIWLAVTRRIMNSGGYSVPVSYLAFIRAVGLATLAYSFNTLFYFLAARSIGTGIAMVIFFTFPAIVTLHAWLTGSWKLNLHGVTAIVALLMGMFLLEGMGAGGLKTTGILFALVAACFYASYIILSRHQMHLADSLTFTLFTCLGNAVFFLVMSYYQHTFILPASLSAWFYIIAFGIISTALPIQLLISGVRCIGPTKASILSVTEPIMMVLVGITFLHEKIYIIQWLGVLSMLVGAILIQFEKPSGETEPVMI